MGRPKQERRRDRANEGKVKCKEAGEKRYRGRARAMWGRRFSHF